MPWICFAVCGMVDKWKPDPKCEVEKSLVGNTPSEPLEVMVRVKNLLCGDLLLLVLFLSSVECQLIFSFSIRDVAGGGTHSL